MTGAGAGNRELKAAPVWVRPFLVICTFLLGLAFGVEFSDSIKRHRAVEFCKQFDSVSDSHGSHWRLTACRLSETKRGTP